MAAVEEGQVEKSSDIFVVTPLLESETMENYVGVPVFMKMENCQPTGSFKLRGLSRFMQKYLKEGHTEMVSSSGGNAGMAVAYTARKLGVKAHLVIPTRTSKMVADRLRQMGAQVYVHGDIWNESNVRAIELAKELGCPYVHPADNPFIWEGHSTMMTETGAQWPKHWAKPSAVVASVGCGGLLLGILEGMDKLGWNDVPVVAMETLGAHSFNESVKAGKLVTLPKMTSIATTLGSVVVCKKLMECYESRGLIYSEVITDKEAVDACLRFADDQRVLVEPSCGATLSSVYSGVLARLAKKGKLVLNAPILVIVCGGSGVSLNQLQIWKEMFQL